MLQNSFDYIFVHLRQKVSLTSELSPKFLSTLGSNPAQAWPKKPGPTYNSGADNPKSVCIKKTKIKCLGEMFKTPKNYFLKTYCFKQT